MLVGGHEGALRNEQLFVGLVGVQQAGHLPPSPQSHFSPSLKPSCFLSLPLTVTSLCPTICMCRQNDPHPYSCPLFPSVLSKCEAQTCDCIITATILDHPAFSLVWMDSHISAFICSTVEQEWQRGGGHVCFKDLTDQTHRNTRAHTHTRCDQTTQNTPILIIEIYCIFNYTCTADPRSDLWKTSECNAVI